MQRFLVAPDIVASDSPVLTGDLSRQMAIVLRLRPADEAILFDGQGTEARCSLLEVTARRVALRVVERRASPPDATTRLHLFAALLKGPRFELAIQKATELGVAAITPVITRRGVAKSDAVSARWQSIVREATEQSGRGRPPVLEPPVAFAEACYRAAAMERALCCSLLGADLRAAFQPAAPRCLAVLTGPEGGFAPEEEILAVRHGILLVSLGPRTLRAETAAIAVCAASLCLAGEWQSSGDEEIRR